MVTHKSAEPSKPFFEASGKAYSAFSLIRTTLKYCNQVLSPYPTETLKYLCKEEQQQLFSYTDYLIHEEALEMCGRKPLESRTT